MRSPIYAEYELDFRCDSSSAGLSPDQIKAVCVDYWCFKTDRLTQGLWSVNAVAKKHGLTKATMLAVVRKHSTYIVRRPCRQRDGLAECDRLAQFVATSRGDLLRGDWRWMDCDKCKARDKAEEQARQEKRCARKAEILRTLAADAYRRRDHLLLKPVQLCLLRALADLKGQETLSTACARVGIPVELGNEIYSILQQMHLIAVCRHGFGLPPGARELIPNPFKTMPAKQPDGFSLTAADQTFLRDMRIAPDLEAQ